MRNGHGMKLCLTVAARMDEPAALRGRQPLVTIADVPVGVECRQVQGDLPRSMRPIHQNGNIGGVAKPDDALDRQHQAGRIGCGGVRSCRFRASGPANGSRPAAGRRDVVDDGEPGPLGDRLLDVLQNCRRFRPRKGHVGHHDAGARALRDVTDRIAHGVVDVAHVKDFIARLKPQRAQDGIAARRRVGDEGHVLRFDAEEAGQYRGRLPERRRQLEGEEASGLRLHPLAPAILRRQHHARRRAERAVIDGQEARIEVPFMPDGRAKSVGQHCRYSGPKPTRRRARGRSACGGSRWCRRRSRRAWRRAAGGRLDSR